MLTGLKRVNCQFWSRLVSIRPRPGLIFRSKTKPAFVLSRTRLGIRFLVSFMCQTRTEIIFFKKFNWNQRFFIQVKEMPNTGVNREIIHIQAPTIHKVLTAYISILWGLGSNLGAPRFASLQITCQNLVGYITDIRKCVCYGDWQDKMYTYKIVYNWKHLF